MADSIIEIPGGSITPDSGGSTTVGVITIIRPYDLDYQVERLAGIFGVGQRSDGRYYLADVCVSPNINKWSKKKPIEYPQTANLSDDQFKGTLEQNRNNIYYGLQVPQSAPSTTLTEDLVEMHDATFEYVGRPTGWKRILDFNGYYHEAVPNPYASFNGDSLEGYVDDEDFETGGLTGITVRYDDSNTRGVDFSSMLQDTGVAMSDVLAKTYPSILITDSSGNSYLTALFCKDDTGTNGPRPLLKDGVYAGANQYYVKFAKEVAYTVAGMPSGPPWTTAQSGMKATIILVRSASSSAPILTSVGGTNFGDKWLKLDTLGHVTTGRPVVVPGGVGKSLSLKLYNAPPITFSPTTVTGSVYNGNPRFLIGYEEITGGSTTSTVTVECTVTLSSPQGGPYSSTTQTFSGYPSTSGQVFVKQCIVTANNLLHSGTKTYTGNVLIRTTVGTKTTTKSKDFSVTITA